MNVTVPKLRKLKKRFSLSVHSWTRSEACVWKRRKNVVRTLTAGHNWLTITDLPCRWATECSGSAEPCETVLTVLLHRSHRRRILSLYVKWPPRDVPLRRRRVCSWLTRHDGYYHYYFMCCIQIYDFFLRETSKFIWVYHIYQYNIIIVS